jgi:hypothetical protein
MLDSTRGQILRSLNSERRIVYYGGRKQGNAVTIYVVKAALPLVESGARILLYQTVTSVSKMRPPLSELPQSADICKRIHIRKSLRESTCQA